MSTGDSAGSRSESIRRRFPPADKCGNLSIASGMTAARYLVRSLKNLKISGILWVITVP